MLVRQLDFDQQHDMRSWKGYYMYRNLFVVHLRYGENALVRLKPYLIALVVLLLAPLRGGRPRRATSLRAHPRRPGAGPGAARRTRLRGRTAPAAIDSPARPTCPARSTAGTPAAQEHLREP